MLLSLRLDRHDSRGPIAETHAGTSPVRRTYTKIDVVVLLRAGLLASPVVDSQSGSAWWAWPASIGIGRPHGGPGRLGCGLLAKFLGQFADLGFGVAAV